MAVKDQVITDKYALYNGDCIEVMSNMPKESIDLSVYSPPFGGLYHYSSDERDLSNNKDYDTFFEHYEYVVKELFRITQPGRMTAVHCMDVPRSNCGCDSYIDFPGDIIRLHEKLGFAYTARYAVWKEPLGVRNRTMAKNLAHMTIVNDASKCGVASADYLLMFRKKGENKIPITNPTGFLEYHGMQDEEGRFLIRDAKGGLKKLPREILRYKGFEGDQKQNQYSHNVWRRYASAFWDDIRLDNVLPYEESRDEDDEKHVHPLQLDVIHRAVALWSNPGEKVFTPFMGVGSEVYGAVKLGRLGIGTELKTSYFKQAVKNLASIEFETEQTDLTALMMEDD